MMLMILIAVVARKRIDIAKATFLSFFRSMWMFVLPQYGESISDVMRSIMAVTASQRLKSKKLKGKDIRVSPGVFIVDDIL